MRVRITYFLAVFVAVLVVSQSIGLAPYLPRLLLQTSSSYSTPPPLTIIIVEEHHHVVPYWVSFGGSARTVLHIDAHSDLGLPTIPIPEPYQGGRWPRDVEGARTLAAKLAVSNDDFMVGAILAGLINKIIWIWPGWLPQKWWPIASVQRPENAWGYRTHVYGVTEPLSKYSCVCTRNSLRNSTTPSNDLLEAPSECVAMNSVGDEMAVARSSCKTSNGPKAETMHMAEASALLFGSSVPQDEGYIVDIDEDFFSVESPFLELTNAGIPVLELNAVFESTLCPRTPLEEQAMDEVLSSGLRTVLEYTSSASPASAAKIRASLFSNLPALLKQSLRTAKIGACPDYPDRLNTRLQDFTNLIVRNLTTNQLHILSQYGFCRDRWGSKFLAVCVGFSNEDDQKESRVALHPSHRIEITARMRNLTRIITAIPHPPQLITICRSVKDGYTPPELSPFIEAQLLQMLKVTASSWRRSLRVVYDPLLWGGSAGSIGRPLAAFPIE